jgi:DNA-binding response OmpR family regulator
MAPRSPSAPGPPVIVVVEGDETVRSALTHNLEQEGCRVVPAGDCRAAVELVAALDLPVDLIISDISASYLQGHALIEELARRGHYPPVFFISTHRPPAGHGTAPEPIVPHPFTPEALWVTVRHLLRRGRPATWTSAHTA